MEKTAKSRFSFRLRYCPICKKVRNFKKDSTGAWYCPKCGYSG